MSIIIFENILFKYFLKFTRINKFRYINKDQKVLQVCEQCVCLEDMTNKSMLNHPWSISKKK